LVSKLATSLPPTWTLAQALLSSSYSGWGTSSVSKDVTEIAACVAYFRTIKKGKLVIMGHSTGSQDVLEYLTGTSSEARPHVDGGILHAPVSDREAMQALLSEEVLNDTVTQAQKMVDAGRGEDILPPTAATTIFGETPVCARRWLSLASPNHDGDDDLFSTDLTDEQLGRTFGSLPAETSLCILMMGSDEYVPPSIDKKTLLERWIGIDEKRGARIDRLCSGVVESATHSMTGNSEETIQTFIYKVHGFLKGLTADAVL
jgi:hypothetical protein